MNNLIESINQAVGEALQRVEAAENAADLEQIRIDYLGRNGLFPELSRQMSSVAPEERKETGRAFNTGRGSIQQALDDAGKKLGSDRTKAPKGIDVTLPGRCPRVGHRHPISQMAEECVAVFGRLGFTPMNGPELEDIYHNFDALNTPADHPSRDAQDTFYLPDGRILRSQTSPVQIRVMETHQPPVRIVAPGRVFRRDTPDATHGMNFHQIEGLYVDRNVSLADLKSVLQYFARELFGKDVKIRLRPHFFPFTEPSVEYDFSCVVCGGKGCPVCKNSGWIEIAGAGMVDPAVFRKVGYDPEKWSGYAFGLGIERLAMLRNHIPDLRLLYDNDVRFLEQF
ncbi:MAG: phenylalanine--tRNA ligase subunit alpha [Victivallaceae bacterium]|nr:phenylalanine--tRNA ligase subunit alpha [Victivallaceae bacterium]